MNSDLVFNLLVVIAALVSVALGLFMALPVISKHFAGGHGGWGRLAAIFATSQLPSGDVIRRQTIAVDKSVYRNCVAISSGPKGIHLAIFTPFPVVWRSPVFIPWSEFKHVDESHIGWHQGVAVSLHHPPEGTITLPINVFEKCRPFLSSQLQSDWLRLPCAS